jgi:hypothetical protein
MAIAMPIICTRAITENVFTMLRWSPTYKIFYTNTLHATHYETIKS